MKKIKSFGRSWLRLWLRWAVCGFMGQKTAVVRRKKTALRIGVLLYRNDDTFIGTLRNSLEQAAKDYEKETGIRVALDVRMGQEKPDHPEQSGRADDRPRLRQCSA